MGLIKSETNNAIIVELANVREHSNADRLKLATVLGTTVIVGLDAKDGNVMVYFDSNLRLSHEYLHHNNLYSNAELNEDSTKKGYFGKNGRVRAQKFREELSNGYVAELHSLDFIEVAHVSEVVFNVGDEFTHINGIEICSKFVAVKKHVQSKQKTKQIVSKMFHTHWKTKQLMREIDSIPKDSICYIEEKIHGTSGRTGNVLCKTKYSMDYSLFLRIPLMALPLWNLCKTKKEWKIVSGTRTVDHIVYHLPEARKEIERRVAPHLHTGEQIYYEIYGYDAHGAGIQKGYPYDCRGGEFKAMLYRVTHTLPDGKVIDLSRKQVYRRAEELGLEKPYLLDVIFCGTHKEALEERAITLASGISYLDAKTLCEGIVVWFEGENACWTCLKLKSPEFLIKETKQRDKGVNDVEDEL